MNSRTEQLQCDFLSLLSIYTLQSEVVLYPCEAQIAAHALCALNNLQTGDYVLFAEHEGSVYSEENVTVLFDVLFEIEVRVQLSKARIVFIYFC